MPPKKSKNAELPVLNERDEDEAITITADGTSILEKVEPYLLFKAQIDLSQTTSNWSDGRSNRLPSPPHVKELKDIFVTGDVQRRDLANRILLGTTRADFETQFEDDIAADANYATNATWRGLWRPGDRPTTRYQDLNWGATTPLRELELLGGQHRKAALEQSILEKSGSMAEDFHWICNVNDLDQMPVAIRLELTANLISPKKAQSSAEIFRDMHTIALELAAADCPSQSESRTNCGGIPTGLQQRR